MRTKLVISNRWHKPQFLYKITVDDMSAEMDMEDFKEALKREIGSVTWTFRKETFSKMLDEAINRIISGVKEASAQVV